MKSPLNHPATITTTLALFSVLNICAVEIDPNFQASVSNGVVHAIRIAADGGILVGGQFDQINGQSVRSFAKLSSAGLIESNFSQPNPAGSVFSISEGSGGQIVISGNFDSVGGAPLAKVARLGSDGSVDATFQSMDRPDGTVDCVAVGADGTVIFGGAFRRINGQPAHYLGRLNPDGAADSSFTSGLLPNFAMEAGVDALALQADGKVVVGGNFDTASGFTYLTRVDSNGAVDPAFSSDHGPILYTKVILQTAGGKLLIAGMADSSGKGFIRRLNTDGSVDRSFTEPMLEGGVEAVAVDENGKIVIGGRFQQVNGAAHHNLARLHPNGQVDETWKLEANGLVKALAFQNNGALLVGGGFTEIGGQAHGGIARVKELRALAFKPLSAPVSGQCHLSLKAEAGHTYIIESSSDFQHWTEFKTCVATEAGLNLADSAVLEVAARFFRARLAD